MFVSFCKFYIRYIRGVNLSRGEKKFFFCGGAQARIWSEKRMRSARLF